MREVNVNENDNYEKPRVFRDRKKSREVAEKEMHHPLHEPYKRTNKGTLRHSLVVDGLGEDYDDQ